MYQDCIAKPIEDRCWPRAMRIRVFGKKRAIFSDAAAMQSLIVISSFWILHKEEGNIEERSENARNM